MGTSPTLRAAHFASGVCTSWNRKGYTFDCCVHNLPGSEEASTLHRIWRELGAVPTRPMVAYDEFVQVEEGARVFTVYTDIDRLEAHLKALSAADADAIKELTNAARRFTGLELLALSATGTGGSFGCFGLLQLYSSGRG
jgi:phytoene dehydrogenase-like protein